MDRDDADDGTRCDLPAGPAPRFTPEDGPICGPAAVELSACLLEERGWNVAVSRDRGTGGRMLGADLVAQDVGPHGELRLVFVRLAAGAADRRAKQAFLLGENLRRTAEFVRRFGRIELHTWSRRGGRAVPDVVTIGPEDFIAEVRNGRCDDE